MTGQGLWVGSGRRGSLMALGFAEMEDPFGGSL